MKLAWSLPALDQLDEGQLEQVWRLAGGHPRSLEYLDALLSGGAARYSDVTKRLDAAITRRLDGTSRGQWLAARSRLDAALAETVTLAADDVLLEDLLDRLAQVPGAVGLLLGASVYREPVDVNAVLFQSGEPDPAAGHTPDRQAVMQQIQDILAAAGITVAGSLDLEAVPGPVREQLGPYLAELSQKSPPPFRPPAGLGGQVAACQAASLLAVSGDSGQERFFVHRWTATELAVRAAQQPGGRLAGAHRQAAAYWQWRVQAWPQDRAADVHDLLEARHHLLQAGDAEAAAQVTEGAVSQLHTWGAWDQEASLIHDTLARLPASSPRQAAWIHQLGMLAQVRGDYDEAARQYQRSLDINERIGNQANMAGSYHQLGNVAYLRGDYDEAARQYQRSLDISERIGSQAGMAGSYHQLGMIAQNRGDYDEAARQYQRSLDIKKRIGDQDGAAATYAQLGVLARRRGNYDEAARQTQRSLDIREQLGSQAGMARCYHALGMIAHDRGDYDEAARQYQRSLDISERIGDQDSMAGVHHELGILAHLREDYDEAARQYQRSLDISERIGNQANMAAIYYQLGMIAQNRGDYDEAARQYQRSLDIDERLGNQAGMAGSYSQLGILEQARDGSAAAAIGWHVRALLIGLPLRIPQAANNLRGLEAYRRELDAGLFTSLLEQAAGDAELAEAIGSLLDQADQAGDETT